MTRPCASRLIILLMLATAGNLPGTAAAQSKKALELDPPAWNFNEAWYGEQLKQDVKVTNVGLQPLTIRDVRASCACTTAELDDRSLAVGESTIMHIGYDSTLVNESHSQYVTLLTDSPVQPEVELHITGGIHHYLEISDGGGRIGFGKIPNDARLDKELTVRVIHPDPIDVKLVKDEVDGIQFKLTPVKPGREYKLEIATKPPLTDGLLTVKGLLACQRPGVPHYVVQVRAIVLPQVAVDPEAIVVGPQRSKPWKKSVTLYTSAHHPVLVQKIECSNPAIKAELVDLQPALKRDMVEQTIEIQIPPSSQLGRREQVVIYTDSKDERFAKLVVKLEKGAIRTHGMTPSGAGRNP